MPLIAGTLLLGALPGKVAAQCDNYPNQYPAGTISVPANAGFIAISDCNYAGELAVVSVVAGDTYTFSTCAADGSNIGYDTQLTLRDEDGVPLAYNDDACGIQSRITWMATYTGVVEIHLNVYDCGSNSTCSKIMVMREVGEPIPPPANDDCTNATPLTVGAEGTCAANAVAGDLEPATASAQAVPSCLITGLTDVWYSFNSGANSTVLFNLTPGTLQAYGIQVLDGCSGSEVYCLADATSGVIPVTPNTDYLLRLLTIPTFAGTYTICVETAPGAPDNDDCANATMLVPAETCVPTSASSVAATESMPAASCSGFTSPAANDVWFQFEATSTGHIIEVSNGTFDMILGIYSDCGTLINCVDDFYPDAYEILTQNGLIVGNTYYVRVYGYAGATGTFDICVMEAPAPPANDDCANVVPEPLAADGTPLQFSGTTVGATTEDGPFSNYPTVWHAFTLSECATVTVSYCGTSPAFDNIWINLGDCPSANFTPAGTYENISCGDGNYTVTHANVAPGTYYIPVGNFDANTNGAYNLQVTAIACPPPPANDDCANATPLTVGAFGSCPGNAVAGDLTTATTSMLAGPSCMMDGLTDVFYSFNSGSNTSLMFNLTLGTLEAYGVQVLEGCTGAEVACMPDEVSGIFAVTPNTDYILRLLTLPTFAGTYTICVETAPGAPDNDDCANATVLVPAETCVPTSASSVAATESMPAASCSGWVSPGANDVWFQFEATSTGHIIEVSNGTFDMILGIYSDCGTLINCVDDVFPDGYENLIVSGLTVGNTYYVRVYGYDGGTGTFDICVVGGVVAPECTAIAPDCVLSDEDAYMTVILDDDWCCFNVWDGICQEAFDEISDACAAGPCEYDLVLELQTDLWGDETSWAIIDMELGVPVCGGGDYPDNAIITATCCVPEGCYRLEVYDAYGDGMSFGSGDWEIGGYTLRTVDGDRIIDNAYNFADGSTSALPAGESFCLPLGEDRPIHTSCDRFWWTSGNFLVATENPAVSAQYGVTNTTSGYEFWFFDPNGSLSFRKFRNHATSDGFAPNNALRACHIQLNNWAAANHLQNYVMYNVRVRGVIDGVELPYGPACRVILDPEEAACTPTGLNDILGHENYSCGVSRTFGGANSPANRVYARSVGGANKYEFEFSNANEGYLAVVQSNTVIRHLNWSSQPPLQVGSTYKVRVRASKDGGNTWCNWGWSCDVTIAPNMAPGGENLALEGGLGFSMWPNPNNGQQLWMEVDGLADDMRTIAVEIHDLSGKRVIAREVAAQHGAISLDLNGDIAAGTYLVTVIAGDQRHIQRLVIAD